MPILRNTFTSGKMSLDKDERLLAPNEYRIAQNIRVINSEGSDVGAIEKTLSNSRLTTLSLGDNPVTLESLEDSFEDKIYWWVKSDLGSYVIEYDTVNEVATKVLEDERIGNLNQLNLSATNRVQAVLIIDSDNSNRLLAFTDNNTQPKLINIERAKGYGLNGFREEQILLIKKPPLFSPVLTLNDTGNQENNIEEKFITIGYRFKYLDGEYSAISPQSEYAFQAKTFRYRFATGTNESMLNNFNSVTISFDTGSDLVTDIELIYKESGSNNLYIIDTFNKQEKGWADNDTETFDFNNNKIYKVLPVDELFRIYDNVPLKSLAIAVINNRIVFGNYTENYNLLDSEQNPINTNFSLSKVQTAITEGVATRSLKTNRDYEIARVYGDEYGRITTPLTSDTNTIYFPNNESILKNKIKVSIPGKAPSFAKFYRFFIKESKQEYETIIPTLFFFEGNFIYFYIQSADVNKVKENDFLIIKADTESIKDEIIKIKVLEVEKKEKNFINDSNGGQPSGFYIKSSILDTDVVFDTNSYSYYRFDSYDQTENSDRLFGEGNDYIDSIFKGDTLDDLDATTDYSYINDRRYEIEIFNTIGLVDTFRWRSQEKDGTFSSWDDNFGAGYDITGFIQVIDPYLSITFDNTSGHSDNDKWLVKINKGFNALEEGYSWAYFAYPDTITIGSIITLKYYSKKEKSPDIDQFLLTFISSGDYENLEEWYFGDEIYNQIAAAPNFSQGLGYFTFRRAKIESYFSLQDSNFKITIAPTEGNYTVLIIRSRADSYNSSRDVYSDVYIEVRSLEQLPIFEKEIESEDKNLDLFYEIGRTYLIDENGNHLGFDGSDVSQSTGVDAELILPIFNCFSWGNGFESYKIRDEFNARTMKLDSRPSTAIENYRQNIRIASFTYGGVFEQSTNYNALNEFNLSQINFKDLDDKYGAIQKIVTWDNDLDVYQDDKVTKVFYDKQLLYNRDGSANLVKSDKILDGINPYTGEFGISTSPESLVVHGNYTYWADYKRGVVLRKGMSGIEIISNFGMRDWFKDAFRTGNNILILGGYDSYFEQYVISVNGFTVTFDEKVKGWTSFHSYLPDEMIKLNNRFYTFKNGDLWLHNAIGSYLSYYGFSSPANITTVFNQEHQFDKIFKTLITESLNAWSISLSTNYTQGTINLNEFNQRESRWFAYIRQNESSSDLRGITQGIGNIQSVSGLEISFNKISEVISIGDTLWQANGSDQEQIGLINSIDRTTGVIIIDSFITTPVPGRFGYGKKNPRIEGSEIRGYYLEVTLEDSTDTANELFAVSTNAVKSYL